MTCPQCGKDYSDTKKCAADKRITVGPLDHYGQNYMIKGIACHHCGFVAEVVTHPTGNPFYKKQEVTRFDILFSHHDFETFLKSNNLIQDFIQFVTLRRGSHDAKSAG